MSFAKAYPDVLFRGKSVGSYRHLQPGNTPAAPTTMASDPYYNPHKHGLIDLRPSGDDVDEFGLADSVMSVDNASTIYQEGRGWARGSGGDSFYGSGSVNLQSSSHRASYSGNMGKVGKLSHGNHGASAAPTFGKPATGGIQYGFTFTAAGSQLMDDGYTCTAVDHSALLDALKDNPPSQLSSKKPRKKPVQSPYHVVPSSVAGSKRKSTVTQPSESRASHTNDNVISNKRRPTDKLQGSGNTGNNYKYNIPTDCNTQHPTEVNGGRGPTPYAWGTSYLRRSFRSAKSTVKSWFGPSNPKPTYASRGMPTMKDTGDYISLNFDNKYDTQFVGNNPGDIDMADA